MQKKLILQTKLRISNNLLTGKYLTNLKPSFLQSRINSVTKELQDLEEHKAAMHKY
jgi:hypothetical protein